MHAQDSSKSGPAPRDGGPARKGPGPRPADTAALLASAGRAEQLSPGAAAALQRAVGNTAFMAALQRDEHAHGPGCGHADTSAQRSAVPEEGRSAGPGSAGSAPDVQRSAVPDVLRSSGTPMGSAVRADMEARLGADFSDVRVHTDGAAKASAAEIGARAYTSGNHVVIGEGGADRHTLAHELTHVIQQRRGPVAGTDNGSGLKVSDPSDRFEREAEANATRVLSGPAPTHTEHGAHTEQADAHAPASVQRSRSENPYAPTEGQTKAHKGWDLTAHHIVPHTTLVNTHGKLLPPEQQRVLLASIPAVITQPMAVNLKIDRTVADDPTLLAELRERLLDPARDGESFYGVDMQDVRHSFFEWQGGNQFLGPNTAIRPEPSEAKDDIDYDGRFFSGVEDFDRLTRIGEELKTPAGATAQNLVDMLALTKDVTPASFDPSAWQEIEDMKEVEDLAKNGTLNRQHLTKYTFFRLTAAQVRDQAFPEIVDGGGGSFTYGRKPFAAQVRGEYVYIKITDDTKPLPAPVEPQELKTVISGLSPAPAVARDGAQARITFGPGQFTDTSLGKKKQFALTALPSENIICSQINGDTVTMPWGVYDKKRLTPTAASTGSTLGEYCRNQAIPTSTYLPKRLYDDIDGAPGQ